MNVTKTIWVPMAFIVTFIAAATAGAQGRRGGPPIAGSRGGTVEHVVVAPDRSASVYLPPAYAADQARRFPVVYFLHDSGEPADGPINQMNGFAGTLAAAPGFSEPIVVVPDTSTIQMTGALEQFVADDLVAYIDGHYRTLAKSISRGLAGHGMGGYGALRIGMKRPDVFSSLYIMSACCLNDGANALLSLLEQHTRNLQKYYSIAIDIGTGDPSILPNRQLHEGMARFLIPHYYEEYEGDHSNRRAVRFERNLLPFFSRNLAAPANPTSPAVQR
jgi:enterochelin esterase-like enzyme